MSWLYQVTGDAWASIRPLEIELQEAMLDELEELVADADDRFAFGLVSEPRFLSVDGGVRVVRFDMSFSESSRVLTLLDVEADDPP